MADWLVYIFYGGKQNQEGCVSIRCGVCHYIASSGLEVSGKKPQLLYIVFRE